MRRYIIFISLVLFITLSTLPAFAEDYVFTLEQVKEKAVKNSRTLKTMEQVIEELNANTNIAYNSYQSLYYGGYIDSVNRQSSLLPLITAKKQQLLTLPEGSPEWQSLNMEIQALEMQAVQNSVSAETGLSASKQAKRGWENTEDALSDTKRAYEDLIKKVEFSVEQLYTSALILQDQIETAEANYNFMLKYLEVERLKGQLGMNSSVDIDKLAIQASEINKGIKQMKDNLAIAKERINDIMGRDVKSRLELVRINVSVPLISVFEPEPIIKNALANIASISQKERDIEKQKKDLDDIDGSNERTVQKAKIEQGLLSLEDMKQNIRNSVNTLVSDLQAKAKAYQLADINFKNSQTTYEWDKCKYDLGMISKLQFEQSELNFNEAMNKKTSASYEYYLAKRLVELAEKGILLN